MMNKTDLPFQSNPSYQDLEQKNNSLSSSSKSFLQVTNLTKHFGGLYAIRDVSLSLEEGKIYGLIGPNGSGKSTLVNLITGFIRPNGGRVIFEGKDITARSPHYIANRGISRTFQTPRSFPDLSLEENILVGISPRRKALPDFNSLLEELLDSTGLEKLRHAKMSNLSYSEKKMTELLRATIRDCSLVIMDEPIAGIDLGNIQRFVHFITDANKKLAKTLLIIEHNLQELMLISDYIFVLHHGEKIFEGQSSNFGSDERTVEAYFG
ncbi:MAG: ABC transporter ATP-binding protein [Nitrososphaerota archaeon]|nr:ABC transporter ATP-binding protein [Nitrososphaerota archaeon]